MIAANQLTHPQRREQLDLCIAVFGAVVDGRETVYLSAPITSGLRFLEWYANHGKNLESGSPAYERQHREQVTEPNELEAQNFARHLRQTRSWQVIDPTGFGAPNWSQNDYRYFWGRVIERYASRVVFMTGWEYSKGCVYEYLIAVQKGIPTFNQSDVRMRLDEGRQRVTVAVAYMESLGVLPGINGEVLETLDQLQTAT